MGNAAASSSIAGASTPDQGAGEEKSGTATTRPVNNMLVMPAFLLEPAPEGCCSPLMAEDVPLYDLQWDQKQADFSDCTFVEKRYNVGAYSGQMRNEKREGYGVCQYQGIAVYAGFWQSDKYHGQGTFKDERSEYSGDFSDGHKHGEGQELWFEDGTRYIGQFHKGVKQGKGRYIWRNGNIYEGDFSNDVVEGYGILFWPDEREYEGQWRNGMQHGEGLFFDAQGKETQVYFWHGEKLASKEVYDTKRQNAAATNAKVAGTTSAGKGPDVGAVNVRGPGVAGTTGSPQQP
ncbi:unnamed protein product [Amoebophrya sp. A25]|nr:unnamed protein product [Amoebophrya sp. A25]|eukprot:GSA25T00019847001.1